MNRDLAREVVGCLRVAGPVEGYLRSLRKFPSRNWEASLNWLNLSGIALAFWDRLQKLGAEDAVPRSVREALAANLADHRGRVAAMTQEFDSLNRSFESSNVEYVAWKGFALIPEYCPDACLRPSYDYDYLISKDSWQRAQDVLQSAGYVLKPEPDKQGHLTFVPLHLRARTPLVPVGLYAAGLPRKVELHLSAWDEETFRIPLSGPDHPLERRVRRNWEGLSFYSLEEQDTFVFQTMHAFQHILDNWCRLGWLLEIAYFLQSRSTDASFWKKLNASLLANDPLTEVVALVISLVSRLFRVAVPAPIKEQIPSAMRYQVALWVDHYGLSSALDNFSQNKFTLFLYREFVRHEEAWQRIRTKRLLPLHRPNRVARTATPALSAPLPERGKQLWYSLRRLIHHSMTGAGYAWEYAHWKRMRRLCTDRIVR